MTKIVSIISLKGGVAKTTTTVQLAECLSSPPFSKKVLVIDLDPQTNATIALIGEKRWKENDKDGQTLFHLFNDKLEKTSVFDIDKALLSNVSNLKLPSLKLLSSSTQFIDIQDRMYEIAHQTRYAIAPMEVLKTMIYPQLNDFDYVLIDCPPNLGFITRNGIEISDYYLIPTIPDTLSASGIPQIVKSIQSFKLERLLKIECLGLLITKYTSNSDTHKEAKFDLTDNFKKIFTDLKIASPPTVFEIHMPQADTTAKAMQFEDPPTTFKEKYGRSKSANIYLHEYVTKLAEEFIKRVGD